MKKQLLLFPLFVFFLFSCASTPKGPSDKEFAGQARDRALSVRADIAAKDEFEAAQAVFDEAAILEKSGNKTAAADSAAVYKKSALLFDTVYESVKSKRDAAQKELDKARADIKKIETRASELDRRGR